MTTTSPYSVFLYYPNLIGYVRILFVLLSYFKAHDNWKLSVVFYTLAFIGDAVDGKVARLTNQSSQFGAVLDMVTDRCSTAGLLMVLSQLYPRWSFHFMLLMFIDLFSHWIHVQSVTGHHKAASTLANRNWLIRLFYGVYPFFAYCCVGTEFFYILMYVLHFNPKAYTHVGGATIHLWQVCHYVCLPACLSKQAVNLAQLCSASFSLAQGDAEAADERAQVAQGSAKKKK